MAIGRIENEGDLQRFIEDALQGDALAATVRALQGSSHLSGDLKATARPAAPTGWLLCDGTSYLRSDYPNLFAALGGAASPWGLPDATHFNVPDLRGRTPVGAGTGAGLTARALAAAGGTEPSNMPDHTHNTAGSVVTNGIPGGNLGTAGNYNQGPTATTGVNGGVSGANNMPPFAVVNWLVKI